MSATLAFSPRADAADQPLRFSDLAVAVLLVALLAPLPLLAMPAASAAAGALTIGSGNGVVQPRAVSDFRAIAVSGSIDIVVRQTGREGAEVHADDNLLPLIETVVEGGTLKVRWKRGESIHSKDATSVTIDVKELAAISTSGSGDVRVESLKAPKLSLTLSGSSDAQLNALTTDELAVKIAGSGDVKAGGKTQRLDIRISGSGDVDAHALQADEVAIAIAGSGDASVVANKSIAVSIAGSGDVTYAGNPASVSQSIAGSGTLSKK